MPATMDLFQKAAGRRSGLGRVGHNGVSSIFGCSFGGRPTGRGIGRARRHDRQREHEIEVVVGLDAVEALEVAAFAVVDDDMLAVGPLKCPNRRHHPTAAAQPVARFHCVDVARVEAVGAMVAMMPAAGQRPYESLAVAAGETLILWAGPGGALRP